MKQHYSSDVTDAQWQHIKKFFDPQRKRKRSLRRICHALFYLSKTGCQWRMLPKSFGHWQSVYYYFRKFKRNGLWDILLHALRDDVRFKLGRDPSPSAAAIDAKVSKPPARAAFAALTALN